MKRLMFVTMVAAMALWTIPAAAQWTQVIDEASIMALNGNVDPAAEDIAVDATGRIYVVDEAPSANEHVLRFDANGTNGVKVTDEAAIIAAVNAVVGSSPAITAFTINSISVAQDGDIILTNGDASGSDCMVSVNPTTFAVTVICAGVNGTPSAIEGCTASCVIGNTAYACVNGTFGAAEDAVLAVDTNSASAPSATASVVVGQTALEGVATGLTAGGALNLGPIFGVGSLVGPGGTLFVGDSSGSGLTDDIFAVSVPANTVSLYVDKADTLSDIAGSTDFGYGGLVASPNGALWGANQFGGGTGDNGVVKFTNVSGGAATTTLFDEASIKTDLGEASGGAVYLGRGAYQASASRILFAYQGNSSSTKEGVIGNVQTAAVADWSMY